MCVKNIFYNTYADGAQDVTEELYVCRDGRIAHTPEVRKYDRKLPYTKGTHFLGDLPTPRPSKSPSPNRRDSTYVPGSGAADKPTKHHDRHDREERQHRRSSRHFDAERDIPSSPLLTRSMTSPHTPHYVVIDQDQSRFKHRDIPPGPVHIANEITGHRRKSSREEPSSMHLNRRNSVNPQSYVVVNDNREQRRQERRERRMSTSEAIPIPPPAPPAPDVHPGSPRRFSRRPTTVVHSSDSSNATTSSASSPPKHVRWDEKMRLARDRHNAEIANRNVPPDTPPLGSSPLKGILKRSNTTTAVTGEKRGSKGEKKESSRRREPETAPKARPVADDLELFDHDRLRARFGSDSDTDRNRERRRRSKVWLADRYQYM
jgi:hypothetical protein